MHLENWAAHGRRRRRVYQAARGPNGLGIGLAVDGAVGRCLALRCRGAFGDPICTGSSSEDQVRPPGRVEIAGVPVNLDTARGRVRGRGRIITTLTSSLLGGAFNE